MSTIAFFMILGVLVGVIYFALLRINAALYVRREQRLAALVLHAARMGAIGLLFYGLAMWGAAPLVATFAGFVAVRMVVVHRVGWGRA